MNERAEREAHDAILAMVRITHASGPNWLECARQLSRDGKLPGWAEPMVPVEPAPAYLDV